MPSQISSYWDLVEPIFSDIDLTSSEKFFTSSSDIFRSILLLYAAHFCLSEVHNGGLLQFFWNSTGMIAPEATEAFEAIGMPKLASLIATAAAQLGSPYPRERDARWDALLMASGRNEEELKAIFDQAPNLYLAFERSTETLFPKSSDEQALEYAETENGGFGDAATRYAQKLFPVQ